MSSAQRYSLLVLNQTWFVSELRKAGHRVLSADWVGDDADLKLQVPGTHIQEILGLLPADFKPDCIIYFDNSGPAAILGIEDSPYPTIFYSVDAHHHAAWQMYYGSAFDRVLVAQKDFVSQFADYNSESYWFPLWAHEWLESKEPKHIPVSFRGNLDAKLHPHRAAFFAELAKAVNIDTLTAPYDQVYPYSKIVINQVVKGDLNFRIFEAMGCGAMLLTPDIGNGLRDLFVPGEDLVVYNMNDSSDALQKLQYYLSHDEERARIAKKGYEKIQRYHLASIRARELINHVSKTVVTFRKQKRFGAAVAYLTASSICRKHLESISDLLLVAASMSVRASLTDREGVDTEKVSCLAHDCRFRLEKKGLAGRAHELAVLLYESNPEDPLNRLALIDSLAQLQRTTEAMALCSVFPDPPEAVIVHARNAMEQLVMKLAKATSGVADGTE